MMTINETIHKFYEELHDRINALFAQKRLSLWLSFAALLLAATQMSPGFATLITIVLVGGLLLVARFVAHLEGKFN
jgi:hypothetical protein